ncbi:uncharacterized protein LOC108027670 [Drosophila biarmipes]|uniref:uncharacterized protein LOC108027670 n=1 Tax=Drosophila biarmipes TaxID=125945 RepID=UPI0007E5C1B2|nr:uncharacterized protein LOC108027670 [Drosophila biarmipes]
MDRYKSSLIPYILDMLSRQPQLCTTKEELIDNIKDIILEEHIRPFGSLKKAVEFALEVGVSLGVISLTDERVRMPFNFRKSRPKFKVPSGIRITPRLGRRVVKQRMPKTAAKGLKKKRAGRKEQKKPRQKRKPSIPHEITPNPPAVSGRVNEPDGRAYNWVN